MSTSRAHRLLLVGIFVFVALAGAATFVLARHGRTSTPAAAPSFLKKQLGVRSSTPSNALAVGAGTTATILDNGYEVSNSDGTLRLTRDDASGAWTHYAHGASRSTDFGNESIVLGGTRSSAEQYVTVEHRNGVRTWDWKIGAGSLTPTLRPDGSVLVSPANVVSGFSILPVAVLDAHGRDVTPKKLDWGLESRGTDWFLTLTLDDRKLPLPYTIDPATAAYRSAGSVNNAGGATTLVIPTPAGLAVNDLMLAQVTVRGGTGNITCSPTATGNWTAVRTDNSTTVLQQILYWKVATAADVSATNYTFTFDNTAGCVSPLAQKASGGIAAFYGVNDTSPIDQQSGQTNGSSTTVTAPSVTNPTTGNILVLAFGTAVGTTMSTTTGTPTFTERWEQASTGGNSSTRTTSSLDTATTTAAGATNTRTSTAGAAAVNIGQTVTLALDTVAPANSLSLSVGAGNAYLSGTTVFYKGASAGNFQLTDTVTETGSGMTSVAFPALGGTTTGWTHTAQTLTTPVGGPYTTTNNFAWGAGTSSSPTEAVAATDNATNVGTTTLTFTNDITAPTGSASVPSVVSSLSVPITTSFTDGSGSGVASTAITRSSPQAPAKPGIPDCPASGYTGATTVASPDTGVVDGMCYQYTVTATDNVGNTSAPVTTGAVFVDTGMSSSSAATAVAGTTLAWSHTTPNRPYRMLVVGIGAKNAVNNLCQATGVTYGAQTLTKISETATTAGTGGAYACSSLWYVVSPNVGTATITVTFPTLTNVTAGAVGLWNVKQASPDAFNQSFLEGGATATGVPTLVNYSRVVDTFATGQAVGDLGPNAGQLKWFTQDSGGSASMGMSTKYVPTSGATTLGWTQTGINRSTHVVAALAPGDVTDPTASVTTPASDGTSYNSSSAPPSIAGTSADTGGSGVASAAVSIRDNVGNYWNGSSFGSASQIFNAATGTTSWTYAMPSAANLSDGHTYTIAARATDVVGNSSTTTRTFVYDTTAPTVSSVTSTAANGTYTSGASLPVTVTFSEPVVVAGSPQLALNSGGTATYSSGSGTNTLTFSYTTAGGENSADLDYSATSSLTLNGGTIRDGATNSATLTLPAVGGANSIGGQKSIVVDTAAPTVSNVNSSTANGAYKSGDAIAIQATFSESVTVTGTPQLALNSGGTATYSSGSGTPTLSFSYTVGGADNASDLDYQATTALTLNGGTIRDAATNDATLTLPALGGASSLGGQKAIVVDTVDPTASVTTPSVNGASFNASSLPGSLAGGSGDTGGAATVASVAVAIQDNGGSYWNGSSFNQASIFYNTATGTTSWTYAAPAVANLTDGHTYTITARATDTAGNQTTTTRTFVYDTALATVSSVTSSTANGAYKSGDAISIQVTFSESVTVTGTPQLALNSGGTATYSSGSGTPTLSFSYTVGGLDNASDLDYQATTALTLNGGTIRDAATNDATLTLPAVGGASSLGGQKAIQVDTNAPTVSVTTPSVNGASFNASSLPGSLAGGSNDGAGSGVTAVAVSIQDGSGNYWNGTTFGSALQLFNATSGAPASWTYPSATLVGELTNGHTYTITARSTDAAGNTGTFARTFVYETTAATVANVTSFTADGLYTTGSILSIQVVFSENVFVTGAPKLVLNTGVSADYASGSGTNTLTFTYTVAAGENAAILDYNSTTSLFLNGGTINDSATNAATLTLPAPGAAGSLSANKNIRIDTTVPQVISVSASNADGAYKAGDAVHVAVTFGENVTVTGTPTLTLNTTPSRTADYAGGSGGLTLIFDYTVQAGDNVAELDYAATSSLSLNGGTIKDAATNDAQLTLPTVGGASSLGGQKNIRIDSTDPTVSITTPGVDGNRYNASTLPTLAGTSADTGGAGVAAIGIAIRDGSGSYWDGTTFGSASILFNAAAGTTSWSFAAAALAGQLGDGHTYTVTGRATDNAGNVATTTRTFVFDSAAPTVTGVTSSTADGAYTSGDAISIRVGFSEPVDVAGTPALALANGRSATYASGTGASTLTFDYTIQPGDDTADLDYAATGSLTGGSIQDTAGNGADRTLAAPGAAGSLAANTNIRIDTTDPTVSVTTPGVDGNRYNGSTLPAALAGASADAGGSGVTAVDVAVQDGSGNYWGGSAFDQATATYDATTGTTAAWTYSTPTLAGALTNGHTYTITARAADNAGNTSATTRTFVFDTTAPTVTGVTATTADGAYTTNQVIHVRVTFSEAVDVTGTPSLAMNTTPARSATYVSGTGTTTLQFDYTIQTGDTSMDLDYAATTSLTAGAIRDAAGNAADRTLAAPGSPGSLGANKDIAVDTNSPAVSAVSATNADGAYKAGQTITVDVQFSEAVTVTGGTPTLALNTSPLRSAAYTTGSGTDTLAFAYTIQAGDSSVRLDAANAGALALNGASIRDGAANDAVTAVTTGSGNAGSLANASNIVVDTTAPAVANVTSAPATHAYKSGDVVSITVSFSEPVDVAGTPQLALNSGGTASYISGSPGTSLTFAYTVGSTDSAAALDYAGAGALTLNGGTITDAAANSATLTLAPPGTAGSLGANTSIAVDTAAPTVTAVDSTTADGAYRAGQAISVRVAFAENVVVTGTPTLALNSGGTATYSSGSGSSALLFTYTVAGGEDVGRLDAFSSNALSGTVEDEAGNDADLTVAVGQGATGALAHASNIRIDTTSPTDAITAPAADGRTYNSGSLPNLAGTAADGGSGVISVGIAIRDGSGSYFDGSGFNSATPVFDPAAGTTSWTYAQSGFAGALADGHTYTITAKATDGAGNSASTTRTFVFDVTAPAVTAVTSTNADGAYGAGQTITLQIDFSKAVTVTGSPELALDTVPARSASYSGGSGTTTLTFSYTVQAGDNAADLDYAGTGALTGGTIEDDATNAAVRTLAAPGTAGSLGNAKDIAIDTAAPTVTGVGSTTANGAYKAGQTIDVRVAFSEPVTVTGTPQLALNSGGSATFQTTTGGDTLVFSYTIGAGENVADLDFADTTSLNGGTIADAAGNAANRTLAAAGAAGSLAVAKDLAVDTLPPAAAGVGSATPNGTYKAGERVDIDVTFTEPVTVTGSPSLGLNSGGSAAYLSTSGSTVTFRYTVAAGENVADLDYTGPTALAGGAIADLAGNTADRTLAVPGAAGSLGTAKNIGIDTTVPAVTSVTSPTADGFYKQAGVIDIRVHFDENVAVTGTPQLALNSGGTATYQSTVGGDTLVFSYTIGAGQSSADLDYAGSGALTGGTIRDAVGNDADRTLASPGTAGSLGAGSAIAVDTTAATVTGVDSTNADGSYVTGDVIGIQVSFSEPLVVAGTPTLALNTTPTRAAAYVSGSSTSTLTFEYTVASGDASPDLDYLDTSSLTLDGGSIVDRAGNASTLTLPAAGGASSLGGRRDLVVDTTAPAVTSVDAASDGAFNAGDQIDVTLTFSEAVDVTGAPTLALNTTPPRSAAYQSGTGTDTLTFRYTVAAGDSAGDLDYAGTSALTLNGGTIRDLADNPATLTLPAVGGPASLGGRRNIVVDTTAPAATSKTVSGTQLDIAYSEALAGSAAVGDFVVHVNGSADSVGGVSIVGGTTLRLALSTAVRHLDTVAVAYTGTSLTDAAGNSAAAYGASAVTNLTPNAAPDAGALVSPADGVFANVSTPTLTGTFDDVDTQDSGKLVFQICSDSSCSTVVDAFDSTSTGLNVGQTGSASGSMPLATGVRYWWRAKSVDSSNASSPFTPVRSFTIDTTKPAVDAAAMPGDGFSYYDATGSRLFVNATATGSFTVSAAAADAQSGIDSVDFPAIFGNAATSDPSSPYGATYTFDGTGTPLVSPGTTTVTARNGVTVPAANTETDSIDVVADAAAPAAFTLDTPANAVAVANGALLSASPTDADSGVRRVDFVYCDRDANALCVPSLAAGGTTTPILGVYSLPWSNLALPDGHYAVAAIATDNVGHTTTSSTISTVVVDNSDPAVAVAAPVEVSGGQYQSYDAGTKTLWLNPSQSGSFRLVANANDAQSGIGTVSFPVLFGTGANGDTTVPYQSALYSFSSPSAQGSKTIGATNTVVDPAAGSATASFTVDVDSTVPSNTTSFPLDSGSYDATSWTAGCAPAGLCGNADDTGSGVGAVEVSIKDRTTGTWFGGTGFGQSSQTWLAATLAGTAWSYALADTALTAPHAYEIQVRATDNVGNTFLEGVKRFTFGSDLGGPAVTLSLTGATHSALNADGSDPSLYHLFFGPTAGAFTFHASSTDPSGVDTVTFPTLFGSSGKTDTNSSSADPFDSDSNGYTFAAGASAPSPTTITATDLAGPNTTTKTVDFALDAAAPTGGSASAAGVGANGYVTTISLTVSHDAYTADVGSGVASSTFDVASASLNDGACGTFGIDSPAVDGAFTATDGRCYRFTVSGTDRVGNVASSTTIAKVDTTAPSQPGVAFSGLSAGNTYDNGAGTIFYRPSAGGAFTVEATSTDAESGVSGYTFAPLAGFDGGATQSGDSLAITFDGATTGSGTFGVKATNRASLDSASRSFTITEDSTAPSGGGLTANGTAATGAGSSSYATSGSSVALATTPYGDSGSGVASEVLGVEQATLANDVCRTYGAPTTIAGTSYSVSNGNCYRFTLTATDRVGNVATLTTTVKVDTTAPVAPGISFTGLSSGNTFASGSTLYYRPSAGGAFTVNAAGATDPETGIKSGNAGYAFTPLVGFATTTQSGNTLDVTFAGVSTGGGAQSVSSMNNASVASTATAFAITPDSGAPTGGLLSVGPFSSSLTLDVAKTDFADAVSGIATNVVTRSDPAAPTGSGGCAPSGYTGATVVAGASDTVPTDGKCYEYTLTGTDRVGNVATFTTRVLVDTTGPTGGSISYVDGLASLSSITVDTNQGTDAESGVAGVVVERASATLSGSTCAPFGSFAPITLTSGNDNGVGAGTCYLYRLVVTNGAGVSTTFTSPALAKITAASPITTDSANPAGVYLGGTTVYVGPSAASSPWKLQLTTLGQNGVTSADWQGKSGPLSSAPTAGTTASSAPFQSGAYQWDGTAPLSDSISVTRNPGGTVDTVSVVSDTANPTGSVSYANGVVTSHSIAVSTTAGDGGSGVGSVVVERASAALVGSTCGPFGAFSPIALTAGSDTSLADETCYEYRVLVTDRVGNAATFGSANVVQVPDVTAPTVVSAATNAAGTQLTLTMSENLDASATVPASAFSVYYDGAAQAPTSVTISGATVTLGLASPPNNNQTVTVRYAQPPTGARLRDEATPAKNETSNFGPSAVTNNTPDTVAPSGVSGTVDGSTATLLFDEDLDGTAPDASAFTIKVGALAKAVTNVAMSGTIVTLTFAPPVASNDSVTVAYAVPAVNGLHDGRANAVAPFTRALANQTPVVAPPSVGFAPAPALTSASPDDGSTMRAVSTIALGANQAVTWTEMSLTRPDGTISSLPNGSAQTWNSSLSAAVPGLYVVHGTITANGVSSEVLTHFTIWSDGMSSDVPPVQKNAAPYAGGEVQSPDGRSLMTWSAGSFSDPVVVQIAPIASAEVKNLPTGSTVVDITAWLRGSHARLTQLSGVVDVRFPNAAAGSNVVTSQDGSAWSDIPQLQTLELPAGVNAGWFRDSDGTVHVLTRHLTHYALVGHQAATSLALRIMTVRRLWLENRSFIAVRMSLTAPARVTGHFVAPDGSIVPGQTIKTPTRHAGITILRVPLTVSKPGLYKLQMHADGLGQVVDRTAVIRFVARRPSSPVWQDGPLHVAVVHGARGLGGLPAKLGDGFVVERVSDADLYSVLDPQRPTAAPAVVVDLETIPAYTLAGLHALLPEVRIVGLTDRPAQAKVYRALGVSVLLKRGAPAATVARAVTSSLR